MTKNDFLLDWYTLKEEKPDKAELFAILEEEAMTQLVTGKEIIPLEFVLRSGLTDVECVDDLRKDRGKFMDLVWFFAEESVYDIDTAAEGGKLYFDVHIDNVGLLWAVSLIYLNAVLWHVTSGLPMNLRIYYANEASRDYTDEMIKGCVLPLFSDLRSYEGIVAAD